MHLDDLLARLPDHARQRLLGLAGVPTGVQLAKVNRRTWHLTRNQHGFWHRVYEWRFPCASNELEREREFLDAYMATDPGTGALCYEGSAETRGSAKEEHAGPLLHAPFVALARCGSEPSVMPASSHPSAGMQAAMRSAGIRRKRDSARALPVRSRASSVGAANMPVLGEKPALQATSPSQPCAQTAAVDSAQVCPEVPVKRSLIHRRRRSLADEVGRLLQAPHQVPTPPLPGVPADTLASNTSPASVTCAAPPPPILGKAPASSLASGGVARAETGLDAVIPTHRESRNLKMPPAPPVATLSLFARLQKPREGLRLANRLTDKSSGTANRTMIDWMVAGRARARTEANLRQARYRRRLVGLPEGAHGPVFVRAAFGRWIAVDVGTRAYLLEIRRCGRRQPPEQLLLARSTRRANLKAPISMADSGYISISNTTTAGKDTPYSFYTDSGHEDDGSDNMSQLTGDAVNNLASERYQQRRRSDCGSPTSVSSWLEALDIKLNGHRRRQRAKTVQTSSTPIMSSKTADAQSEQTLHTDDANLPVDEHDGSGNTDLQRQRPSRGASADISANEEDEEEDEEEEDDNDKEKRAAAEDDDEEEDEEEDDDDDDSDETFAGGQSALHGAADDRVRYVWHTLEMDLGATDQYGWAGNGVVRVLMNNRYMIRMMCATASNKGRAARSTTSLVDIPMRQIHVWCLRDIGRASQLLHRRPMAAEPLLAPHFTINVRGDATPCRLINRWLSILVPSTMDTQHNGRALQLIDVGRGVLCPGEVAFGPDDTSHLHAGGETRAFVYQCNHLSTSASKAAKGQADRRTNASTSDAAGGDWVSWRLWQFTSPLTLAKTSNPTAYAPQLIGHGMLYASKGISNHRRTSYVPLHSKAIDMNRALLWSDHGWVAVHHLRRNALVWERLGCPLLNVTIFPAANAILLTLLRQARAVMLRLSNGAVLDASSSATNAFRAKNTSASTAASVNGAASGTPVSSKAAKAQIDKTIYAAHYVGRSFFFDVANGRAEDTSVVRKPKKSDRRTPRSAAADSGAENGAKHAAPSGHLGNAGDLHHCDAENTAPQDEAHMYWPEGSLLTPLLGPLVCRTSNGDSKAPVWLMDLIGGGTRIGLIRSDPLPKNVPSTWAPAVDTRVAVLAAGPRLVDVHQRNAQLILWDFLDV
ncbi:hypothetical protein THASP1DRAFT_28442 [Thamnocephalis sphaerospora]|uniref:F-box domain-containing protein n=1 Tax=Thamnocephalis sphaerospora TaxID=78915 RepID=A0A4P9XU67_9FUNG|nr:hypothetical protein THASP1DRAFT_28442 [Thamnocephalis sphaerospora]|eukprot:RKP09757.1 hypothetical protein THASP1DRAFT_28442 [Thamnocephalis sphaerospora]